MARNPLLKDKPSTSNNHSGKNGRDNGDWPDEEILKAALYRYSQERLPLPRRIKRLGHELQLDIGLTLLKNLNKHFGIPSSRKAPKALQMGGVALPIYGYKDKCSSVCIQLVIIPNNRKADVVGHTYCDWVSELGCIPLQLTFDKGSETGELYAMQTAFREVYAPEIDTTTYPPCHAMKSVHNTPIESFWHAFRQHTGRNLYAAIVRGKEDGIFHVNNELHECLFYWIWPQIVQRELTDFRDYWNMHKLRVQRDKLMPSGTTPTDLWIAPEDYGHVRISIPVPRDAVEAMRRERLPISRDEAFSWVDHEFATSAEQAYSSLGCPRLNKDTAWEVFSRMEPMLKY
ncbi:hypothetical protein EVJ58_g1561 [Rhodofomes roseus]|uniref:Integrase core domain-containing protein n=1 Tax=Rhodofomes roseus TaxID=34475 RepID=A0A4Y9Z136_9APHY|nr:hypothetical protein EVJ58_g1561 [Rhodofomes roseus]